MWRDMCQSTGVTEAFPSCVDIHRRDLVDKDSNKNYINFVHLNLCIALAIGLLIFMAGIQGGSGSTVSFVCFSPVCHKWMQ